TLVIGAVAMGGSLRQLVLATLAASALSTAAMLAFAGAELRRIPKVMDPQRKPPVLQRFVRLAGLTWLEKLSSYLYGTSFLTLLAASMFDKVQVGFFALAGEFTIKVLSFVLSPTHGIVLPAFSVVFVHGTQEQRQDVFSASLRALGLLLW